MYSQYRGAAFVNWEFAGVVQPGEWVGYEAAQTVYTETFWVQSSRRYLLRVISALQIPTMYAVIGLYMHQIKFAIKMNN